jgi:hypothetical protein
MPNDDPVFSLRSLGNGAGYVIDVRWPDGTTEQLVGVFTSPGFATRWINDNRETWVRDRLGIKIH